MEIMEKIKQDYEKAIKNATDTQHEFAVKFMKEHNFDISDKTICEFGVCTGHSMLYTTTFFDKYNIYPYNFLGFDSFVGLPETGIKATQEQIAQGYWVKGQFSATSYLNVDSVEKAKEIIMKRFVKPKTKIELIDGYFCNSLNDNILNKFHKICWLDVDCDLYQSAADVLNFVFKNNLVETGTIVSYDDWSDGEEGECLAHKEISKKYNVEFENIFRNNVGQNVFIIKNIGGIILPGEDNGL